MNIIYNGIDLGVLQTHEFAYETMYSDDGVDYLGTRVQIHVTALVNGQAEVREIAGPPISYIEEGTTTERELKRNTRPSGIADPGFLAGPADVNFDNQAIGAQPIGFRNRPPGRAESEGLGIATHSANRVVVPNVRKVPTPAVLSHTVVRKKLTSPRGTLFVFNGTGDPAASELLLQSPAYGDACDIRNGPSPKLLNIVAVHGEGTFVVDFMIETYVNEQKQQWNGENPDARTTMTDHNVLLSNRFSSRHVFAPDDFLEVHVQGSAIFRTDLLYRLQQNPDQFRMNLFLPVPYLYIRGDIVVEGNSDGSGVRYSFIDRQQRVSFPAAAYTKAKHIEALHKQTIIIDNDVLSASPNFVRGVLKAKSDINFAGYGKGEENALADAVKELAAAIKGK